jgi:hypothetical protein
MFVFDVTMQNHSSYSKEYDNFTPDVEVENSNGSATLLERYLSLIKVSDSAFEQLIDYFSNVDEPTVILMFGDHQPADWVVAPIYKLNGITDTDSWSESEERYEVPFVLWANYDIEEETVEGISANYLNTLLFEAAGLPMSPYQLYMKDMMASYPIVTANMVVDAYGNKSEVHIGKTQLLPEDVQNYAILNYNHLFDVKHRGEYYEIYTYGGYTSGSGS